MDSQDSQNTNNTKSTRQLIISLPCSRSLQKFVIKNKLDLKARTGFDLIEAEFTDCEIVLVGPERKRSGYVQNVQNFISSLTSGILEEKLEFPDKIQKKFWEKRRIKINQFLRSNCSPEIEIELLEKENQILFQGRDPEEIELVRNYISQILEQLIGPPLPREKSSKKPSLIDPLPSAHIQLENKIHSHSYAKYTSNCTGQCKFCQNFKSFCESLNDQELKLTAEKIFVEKLKDQYKVKFKLLSNLQLEIKGRYCELVKFEILDKFWTSRWLEIDRKKISNRSFSINQDQVETLLDRREFWNKYQIFVKHSKHDYNNGNVISLLYNTGNPKVEDFMEHFNNFKINFSDVQDAPCQGKIQAKKPADAKANNENKDCLFQLQHSLKRKPHLNKNLTNTDFNLNFNQ